MKTWIVLIRGINVGGRNIVRMAEFRRGLEMSGFDGVKTYIQSGNVVLKAKVDKTRDEIQSDVEAVLRQGHDVEASVMVLTPQEMSQAAQGNPLLDHMEKPNWMFLSFLSAVPKSPDLDTLDGLRSENERFALEGKVFYFYAGDGAARSKVLSKAEKCLGVSATARNWNTVQKLLEMTGEADGG